MTTERALEDRVVDLEAEVARLRAVLARIAEGIPGCDAEYLAREALGLESDG